MPIRADLKPLYGPDWPALSRHIRFVRAQGRCEACGRAHVALVFTLPGGGWIDPSTGEAWLAGGRATDLQVLGMTRVSLSTAHRDHDPANNAGSNLAAWCRRCHLAYDLQHHLANRRLTIRSRLALADLFEGTYGSGEYPGNV